MAQEAQPEPQTSPIATFEADLAQLEKVVQELESGELDLERSLKLFEQGMSLSESCRNQLLEAETRVEAMIRKEGRLEPVPFDPSK
jgi:exodeoxyribonuclease VII small subunit